MIYNLIVDSQQEPLGEWVQSVTVKVEVDSNPEFLSWMPPGTIFEFKLSGSEDDLDDGEFMLARIDEIVRAKIDAQRSR